MVEESPHWISKKVGLARTDMIVIVTAIDLLSL
jgi:hypothetical protein